MLNQNHTHHTHTELEDEMYYTPPKGKRYRSQRLLARSKQEWLGLKILPSIACWLCWGWIRYRPQLVESATLLALGIRSEPTTWRSCSSGLLCQSLIRFEKIPSCVWMNTRLATNMDTMHTLLIQITSIDGIPHLQHFDVTCHQTNIPCSTQHSIIWVWRCTLPMSIALVLIQIGKRATFSCCHNVS